MVSDDVVASFIIAWVGGHSEQRTLETETMWTTCDTCDCGESAVPGCGGGCGCDVVCCMCVMRYRRGIGVMLARRVVVERGASESESFAPAAGRGKAISWSEITTGWRRRTRGQGGNEGGTGDLWACVLRVGGGCELEAQRLSQSHAKGRVRLLGQQGGEGEGRT
jgi:hypothetical protein